MGAKTVMLKRKFFIINAKINLFPFVRMPGIAIQLYTATVCDFVQYFTNLADH